MKKNIVFTLFISLSLFAHAGNNDYLTDKKDTTPAKTDFIQENINFATKQLTLMLNSLGEPTGNNYPRTINSQGKLEVTGKYDWISGFLPGSLWYLYELTGDTSWKNSAAKWTESLEALKTYRGTHDLGFMMYCSYGNAERLAPKPEYKGIIIESAHSMTSRFNDKAGVIKSWNRSTAWDGETEWLFPVIIDNMMNLEMVFYAAKTSGDKRLYDIAISHANTTIKNHFREDFGSYHVLNYDTITGAVKHKATAQGFSDNSTWARGQAWGIYGYTVMYRETKDKKYLDTAVKLADYYLSQLPEDLIPVWDFNVGETGYTPGPKSYAATFQEKLKDSSAGAIVCSALFELAGYVPEKAYSDKAIKMLYSLASEKYRAPLGKNGNFILMHGVGSIPHKREIDTPLSYGDYYFLEALTRYKNAK